MKVKIEQCHIDGADYKSLYNSPISRAVQDQVIVPVCSTLSRCWYMLEETYYIAEFDELAHGLRRQAHPPLCELELNFVRHENIYK